MYDYLDTIYNDDQTYHEYQSGMSNFGDYDYDDIDYGGRLVDESLYYEQHNQKPQNYLLRHPSPSEDATMRRKQISRINKRQQRQRKRLERFSFKHQNTITHRPRKNHKYNSNNDAEKFDFNNENRVQRKKPFAAKQRPMQSVLSHKIIPGKRRQTNERQGEFLIASPAGLGIAWFASLIGIAVVARESLSTVLGGVNPWTQFYNGTNLVPSLQVCANAVDGNCPVDCQYFDWNMWSSCTVTCGGGIKLRSRLVKTHELYGGKPCDGSGSIDGKQTSTEKTDCNTQICPPVNCVWGTWDTWATCSQTCGSGVQVRTRKVDTHEENGGTACTGLSTEQQNCNTATCPAVNCVWGTWDTWATCSFTCGGGVQVRTRKIDTHEENGGTACTGFSTEQQNCNTATCPAINCVWGTWSSYSTCGVTCGGSVQIRSRIITTYEQNGGTACTGNAVESQDCATNTCP